jgi:hypothetical protein
MSIFSKVLAILNLLAAGAFGYLAFIDHVKRQQYAYAAQRHEEAIEGLPTQEQTVDPRLSRELYLSKKAKDKNSPGLQEDFRAAGVPGKPVNVQKQVLLDLKAANGPESVFAAIRSAAKEAKAANLKKLLLPLAANGPQLRDYLKRLKAVEGNAGAEKKLAEEAARRRMLAQALLPLEELRPGGHREQLAAAIGDLDTPYKKLEQILLRRIDDVLQPQADYTRLGRDGSDTVRETVFPLGPVASPDFRLLYRRDLKAKSVTVRLLDPQTYGVSKTNPSPVAVKVLNVSGTPTINLAKKGSNFTGQGPAFGTDQVLELEFTLSLKGKAVKFTFVDGGIPLDFVARPDKTRKDLTPDENTLLTTLPNLRLVYTRSPAQHKVTVWVLDGQTDQVSTANRAPVAVKLTNVDEQPTIDLGARDGSGYTGSGDAFGPDQVLAGAITITLNGKPATCYFRERDALEHRQAIAYLIFTLSQVTRPDGKPLLDSLSEKRLETIVGRKRYNHAIEMQTTAFRHIEQRRLAEIEYDLKSFVERYELEIKERLPYIQAAIKRYQALLADWEKQRKDRKALLKKRQKDRDDVLARLKKERQKATQALKDLALWQQRLFLAQEAASGVAERNEALERELRKLELGR